VEKQQERRREPIQEIGKKAIQVLKSEVSALQNSWNEISQALGRNARSNLMLWLIAPNCCFIAA
jgi:hypothetical protein